MNNLAQTIRQMYDLYSTRLDANYFAGDLEEMQSVHGHLQSSVIDEALASVDHTTAELGFSWWRVQDLSEPAMIFFVSDVQIVIHPVIMDQIIQCWDAWPRDWSDRLVAAYIKHNDRVRADLVRLLGESAD